MTDIDLTTFLEKHNLFEEFENGLRKSKDIDVGNFTLTGKPTSWLSGAFTWKNTSSGFKRWAKINALWLKECLKAK